MLDADELPEPEVLLFLKLYDGYTEPIRFGFKWTVFGFYWLKTENEVADNLPFLGKSWPNLNNKIQLSYALLHSFRQHGICISKGKATSALGDVHTWNVGTGLWKQRVSLETK